MLFVATAAASGSVGTPLVLSATLRVCQQLSFADRLGNVVSGALRGIV